MARSDPIRANYYQAVERAEFASGVLFYIGALLSFSVLLVDPQKQPALYEALMIVFGLTVIANFVVGLVLRLYLTPRAEDTRRQDFFSSACSVELIHQQTNGYYNNDCRDPIKRIAAQVLENSLFSKVIALRMARIERIRVAAYASAWLVLVHYRQADIGWIVAASQAVFSEQLLSKWLRVEWLRTRFERTFADVYRLFQLKPALRKFNAQALDAVAAYETAKANAAITLSATIFDELNVSLSEEWNRLRTGLGL
jgi:hypothetical protein